MDVDRGGSADVRMLGAVRRTLSIRRTANLPGARLIYEVGVGPGGMLVLLARRSR